ncbi:rhomboid family intramembrane serine protease [Sulfobacillus harzensis]|uniref:Rhomboid family intramembrane serine protease n=1 Tax=Sulfobacillus harzensis TaxID=2729629 RepID=A0A7Y0Q571_9FIRM|nr:rhomboid family intramembrane serine protease [Sulfobacillus harzensis]NMP24781.1 rhomboid family intramembrane serine protease [Sulfobacillus harzensis]
MDRETRKYWQAQRKQMLARDRRQRRYFGQDMMVTKILIALMIVAFIVERFVPGVIALATSGPGGIVLTLLISALSPGSFIGLLFAGFFLWIIGSQIEGLTQWWQYLIIFFGSGIVGGLATSLIGAGLTGGTFASFGLAGAYVAVMASRRVGGAAQWAILLLAINVVLSGFQAATLAGMLAAFFAGLLIARAMKV